MGVRQKILVAFFSSCVACQEGETRAPDALLRASHPQEQWLYRPIPVSSRIGRDAAKVDHPLAARLASSPLALIGTLEGTPTTVFGEIADVALDDDHRVYVLDSQFREVRVFNALGEYITRAGGEGQGPGEFPFAPRAVVVDGNGQVFTLDFSGIQVFAWKGDTLAYQRTLRFRFQPEDMCILGDTLFVHSAAMEEGGIITRVQDGAVTASFGDVYSAPTPVVGIHVRRSRLECVTQEETLAVAPGGLIGEIHGYSAAGEPTWIAVIDGFRPVGFEQNERGGVTVTIPAGGYDRLYSLTDLGNSLLLAQVAYISREDYNVRAEYSQLVSFLVDSESGVVSPIGDSIPRVLASTARYFVSVRQDPYPQVAVHRW